MDYRGGSIIPIKELPKYVKRKVSLLGFVLEFSIPRKSQGTDYVSILRIVDESRQSPELLVNIFTETIDQLPHVRSHGDLILLNNVLIKKYDEELTAVFYKNSSSFALFEGKLSKDILPYQSSQSFYLTEFEKDYICRLRHWCVGVKFSSGSSDYLLSLKDIAEKRYFDLVCKVLHVSHDVQKEVWMLYVWDGMDAPPASLHGKLEHEEQNPLPLHIESSPLDWETLNKFYHVGTVLRVRADETHENFGQHFTATGNWVRIRNMTCQVSSGMWLGLLPSSTRIRLLSNNDVIVQDCNRKFKERITAKHGRMPIWTNPSSQFLTVLDGKDTMFVTLMDIVTYPKVNVRFRCIVRVVAIYPSQVNDFSYPNGSSEYRMRLTLEDPTARIHAILCDEAWVKFFEGTPPADVLSKKIRITLGVPEHRNTDDDSGLNRSPPWIQCCILSRESDNGRNTLYYICSTRLVTQ